jgi:hypothetical protein
LKEEKKINPTSFLPASANSKVSSSIYRGDLEREFDAD